MKAKNIWAIIPAYNEERRVKEVIKKTKRYVKNIIVMDDGYITTNGLLGYKKDIAEARVGKDLFYYLIGFIGITIRIILPQVIPKRINSHIFIYGFGLSVMDIHD